MARRNNMKYIDVSNLGTVSLFQSLARLRHLGLIEYARNSANGSYKLYSSNLSSAKFFCAISEDEALDIAGQIGFPLDKYI